MSEVKLKEVRALRTGSYDGHRRRAGVVFCVREGATESWFEDVGPAPADASLPVQLEGAQAPRGKTFIDVMKQLGQPQAPAPVTPVEQTLREAAATLPVMSHDANADLLG